MPRGDALQVFVAAVIMGFQGTYRERPDSLETWLRMNRQRIKLSNDRPSVPSTGPEVAGAGPLTGHVLLLWSVFSSLLFAAIFIVTTWSVFYLL